MTPSSNGPACPAPIAGARERADRWQHLVTCAFLLEETPPARTDVAMRMYLRSVLEVFERDIDPVDDFEGYAVRRLATSLLRILDGSEAG
ncbi:MAG: hypothetical protein Q7V01_13670 [Vicinamibacterales bacterium]|nr:hypothetical protein [Vicinamibacterales bacterium]